jgi:hypothetical protein
MMSRGVDKASTATITTDEWSLLFVVEPGQSELYHMASDPRQERNVIAQHPDIAQELHQLFVRFSYETNLSKRLLEPRLKLEI